jgi:Fe-S oxidoreductase
MALEDFAAEMERCSQCSYCKWIPFDQVKSWRFAKNCPSIAYHDFNSYSARGRYAVGRSLLRKQSAISPQVQRIAFSCLACGACDVACKVCRYNLEPLEMVRELKFHLVQEGGGLEAHRRLLDGLQRHGNSLGGLAGAESSAASAMGRSQWAEGLQLVDARAQPCEVLFHAGCAASFDPGLRAPARAAVRLLLKAGLRVGSLGPEEACCGGRVYSMGYREEFQRLAGRNIAAWRKAGVRTVVTACADGYHAFKRLYPPLGSQVEVLHAVEMVQRLAAEGRLAFRRKVPLTVTYHDPCHLGRQGEPYVRWQGVEKKLRGQIVVYEPRRPRNNGAWGVYDPPRELLCSIPGLKLVEMERIREYSWCCGAGGGMREAYPDFSLWTAGERLEEARATGAAVLASACPWCERNFRDAVQASSGPRVCDVLELALEAL